MFGRIIVRNYFQLCCIQLPLSDIPKDRDTNIFQAQIHSCFHELSVFYCNHIMMLDIKHNKKYILCQL